MKRNWMYLFATIVCASFAFAQTATPQKPHTATAHTASSAASSSARSANLPSEETVNSFMREMMGFDPNVTWKVDSIQPAENTGLTEVTVLVSNGQGSAVNKFYVTADGKHAITGEIIPFGEHPFDATSETLAKGANGVSRGPANAPVTIVEFSDLQCPHCKTAQPVLEKLLSEDTNVRVVYQNFPLPMHDWARLAAGYADCIGRKSKSESQSEGHFWKFIGSVYDAQNDITASNAQEKLTGLADQAGEKGTDIAACAAATETLGRVQRSISLGTAVGVNSTPTVFINGRKITSLASIPYESLKQLVDFTATGGKQ
jgi:protein-disulfide isomerase